DGSLELLLALFQSRERPVSAVPANQDDRRADRGTRGGEDRPQVRGEIRRDRGRGHGDERAAQEGDGGRARAVHNGGETWVPEGGASSGRERGGPRQRGPPESLRASAARDTTR